MEGYLAEAEQVEHFNMGKIKHHRFRYSLKPNPERDEAAMTLLRGGQFTLDDVGGLFGITRERVRQIYKKYAHAGYRQMQKKRQEEVLEQKKQEKERMGNEIRFRCVGCGKEVLRKESQGRKYCPDCRIWALKYERKMDDLRLCIQCGKMFPSRRFGNSYFCNQKHHFDFLHVNIIKAYNNLRRG